MESLLYDRNTIVIKMITFCGPFCNSSLPNYGVGDNLYLKRLKKMNSSFRYHFNCCLFRRGTFAAVSNTSMENYLNFCRLMDYNIHRGIFLSPIQKCITPPLPFSNAVIQYLKAVFYCECFCSWVKIHLLEDAQFFPDV